MESGGATLPGTGRTRSLQIGTHGESGQEWPLLRADPRATHYSPILTVGPWVCVPRPPPRDRRQTLGHWPEVWQLRAGGLTHTSPLSLRPMTHHPRPCCPSPLPRVPNQPLVSLSGPLCHELTSKPSILGPSVLPASGAGQAGCHLGLGLGARPGEVSTGSGPPGPPRLPPPPGKVPSRQDASHQTSLEAAVLPANTGAFPRVATERDRPLAGP